MPIKTDAVLKHLIREKVCMPVSQETRGAAESFIAQNVHQIIVIGLKKGANRHF